MAAAEIDRPMDFEAMENDSTAHGIDVVSKDVDGVPYCRVHHCRMRVRSGAAKSKGKDYYSCPVENCRETGIRIRTNAPVVPPLPQECPRCSVRTDDKTKKQLHEPVYCERDERRSTATGVVLVCPRCKWNAGMFAVPQLEVARLSHAVMRHEPDVGDR